MEVELDVRVDAVGDGSAVLTVTGPLDGVLLAYGLMMQSLQLMSPDSDELGDSSVG